jgi:hypothetical protein
VVWTHSWPNIAGACCSLICVGAGEEWVRKVYALRGLRGVERDVGLTPETRWPAGLKDRYGEPEGGSEWEPIKILLEGDGNSNKTNSASNTRHRLTTQVGLVHTVTEVILNLGTKSQPHRPENAAEHQNSSPLTNTGQTGEHHWSDRSLLVKPGDFHRMAPQRSGRWNTPVKLVSAKKPQNTKQAYRAPN